MAFAQHPLPHAPVRADEMKAGQALFLNAVQIR
jgi:hypothetical protein